ncbi:rab-GTPase-TBC domain-containing protein [Astrocystis sublimbata]|nr:rab-GTPase-TBC domain-containing protein [Astrocystis sublimbata]
MDPSLDDYPKNEPSPSVDSPSAASNMIKSPTDDRIPGHDSMVTVRLSEPPSLSVNTDLASAATPSRRSIFGPEYTPTPTTATTLCEDDDKVEGDARTDRDAETPKTLHDELKSDFNFKDGEEKIQEEDEEEDSDTEEVDWEMLQKTENEQVKDADDNVRMIAERGQIIPDIYIPSQSTEMLLARLEQENNLLATNPKSVKVKVVEQLSVRRPRPPSMAQLREMVNGPTPTALRYSVLPPPPMTDLEFYMALVKDYQQTAARLPTLLSNKIRKGIPPPLRGVVWQSMASARDTLLLEQFDRLSGESSPYEGIIGKDLGRSFPGVEMFRDPEGDGQRMLGRVLKCFSLYDHKIGYCQGLAFIVGPLLMHMPDNQAFCVLIRLMENYDLRSCYLPDLSGLHVRIYQFRELLRQDMPALSAHLDDLQVDPAYVSQWFLSFFAVTCPLPMLFRIYDVIFAEGASETIMRVALSLMRKNQGRILACTELEDVMQLLLSRGLWDCYHYNADEFVNDFVGLSNIVSREKLAQLEQRYREEKIAIANTARTADVTTAASRFLGRLWTASSPRPGTLSPGLPAPLRPLSMLRRSTSKQSLASTLNSMEASSSSVLSSSSTDATTVSRESSNVDDASIRESTPVAPKSHMHSNANDKNLHTQIEDLLTALSELQRNHSLLADQLQKEREEREEDGKTVKSLLVGLKAQSGAGGESVVPQSGEEETQDEDTTSEPRLSQLVHAVEDRFGTDDGSKRNSLSTETKSQLRDELVRAKENLTIEMSKSQEYNRRIDELGQEASSLREQLRESHAHVRNLHQDKQRLEKQIHTLRVRASADTPRSAADAGGWFSGSTFSPSSANNNGGLRELKLGRSKSTPNTQETFDQRSSSLSKPQNEASPSNDYDTLVADLVQAKTAEAVARQEADEYKQKLESLRKACGLAPGETPAASNPGIMGVFALSRTETSSSVKSAPTAVSTASNNAGTGGFWGWRR